MKDFRLISGKKLIITAGTKIFKECQRINDEVWLPSKTSIQNPLGNIFNRTYLESSSQYFDLIIPDPQLAFLQYSPKFRHALQGVTHGDQSSAVPERALFSEV